MLGRRRATVGPDGPPRRRSGPPGEQQWWDSADQASVETTLFKMRDFPKGWRPAIMPNNVEVLDPYEGVTEADAVRHARAARRLTALDEGIAYRGKSGQLAVLRTEMFADGDDTAHRAAWQRTGAAVLTATYRSRWAERGVMPNWIDTTVVDRSAPATTPDTRVDWLRVQDHTNPRGPAAVTVYEHLTLWAGRAHVVVTMRHQLDDELERVADRLSLAVLGRLDRVASRGPDVAP